MKAIGYYLALPLLYLISLLPAPLLYLLSDFIFIVLYYVSGYRKKVVTTNLTNAFPEKSIKEIKRIQKKYYVHLSDIIVETIKTLTMSRKFTMKHCTFSNEAKTLFDTYFTQKKNIIVVMGHYGNWEWSCSSFSLTCPQKPLVLYRPLRNSYWDKFMIRLRERFGAKTIAMNNTFRQMLALRNKVSATVFAADQTPPPDNAFWITFLNQETAVFKGTELIAKKFNYPVVFASVRKQKRGYYEVYAVTLFEEPAKTSDEEITKAHTRMLEEEIRRQPEFWLWSHRRWKHKKPVH